MTIQEVAKLSFRILHGDTQYSIDKNIIDSIFKNTKNIEGKELIRLTVIDSFYSTNMTLRIFGLYDLAENIKSIGDDDSIKIEVEKYLENKENLIENLFTSKYGLHKNGKSAGLARSLVSKYLYFLLGHEFPIEDSLVRKYIRPIVKHFKINIKHNDNVIILLNDICKIHNISIDEMDTLIWLFGKIVSGSFSLILNKDKYMMILKFLNVNEKMNSAQVESILKNNIMEELRDEKGDFILSEDLRKFIDFCKIVKI